MSNHRKKFWITLAACGCAFAVQAQVTGAIAYPARNQSPQQQEKDRFECYEWARAQSGFDPTQLATAAPASAPAAGGGSSNGSGMAGHMVGGAVGGAAIGELTKGDAGRSAAMGALGGAALQRLKEQQAQQQRQAQAAQGQAQQGQQRALYQRAMAACMEARGYVLK